MQDKEWEFRARVRMFQQQEGCLEKAIERDGVGAPEGLLYKKGSVKGYE